jgi:hypothetical protein
MRLIRLLNWKLNDGSIYHTEIVNRYLFVSKNLAFLLGVFLPLAETVRRWNQLTHLQYFVNWFDDYLFGVFLLLAAWKTHKDEVNGQKYLSAAWGVATGALFLSTFGQLERLGQPDPAQASIIGLVVTKGMLLVIALIGMVLSLRKL